MEPDGALPPPCPPAATGSPPTSPTHAAGWDFKLSLPPPLALPLPCCCRRLATDIPDMRSRLGISDTQVFGGQGFSLVKLQLQVGPPDVDLEHFPAQLLPWLGHSIRLLCVAFQSPSYG
jgi:hypothetical protein